MKYSVFAVALLSQTPSLVFGHATFQESAHGSVDDDQTCVRTPLSNSPVTDVNSANMACNQVKVAGSEGGQLSAGVKIPGAYSAQDSGILIDIGSNGFKTYTILGPAVVDQSFF
ncbi:hypothetical protein QBC46DRAFT_359497 [Diplogelasinospora grovesii]|uniref:lytic cellulose monooxygenase (C4-dehydrogenating) n=1 Tax=Diplogelasinospora grovesii TaxID=303347 RepID=A0AAN6RYE8_9PEZI|nr:hypothetical protein QBC46DRAFT_359497 [Diplogelasinospora grovesii]